MGVVSPFVDVNAGSAHAADIECLYELEITKGTGADTYGPRDPLRATQITRFLYRTYQKAGGDVCPGTAGSELDRATECLLRLRVVPTTGEATATAAVTRAQMGVYVVGLWHNLSGRGLPPPPPLLGAATPSQLATPRFKTIIASGDSWCGIKTDNTITCWGNNEYGRSDAPTGTFKTITPSFRDWCGIKTDNTITCWGDNRYGQTNAPPGTFQTITDGSSGGYGRWCGIKTDNTITCWGSNRHGQTNAPPGTFQTITRCPSHRGGLQVG